MSIGLRPGYFGGNYLGVHHNPFETEGDPNAENFQVQNVGLSQGLTLDRLSDRRTLLTSIDSLRREADTSGMFEAMDKFDRTAFDMVTGARTRDAFDLSKEDPKTRDLYGRHSWGQSTLLARRLVEAGTTFVSCHFGGWDHHWDLKTGYENYLPKIDQLVYALLTDLVGSRHSGSSSGGAVRRIQPHATNERRRQRRSHRSAKALPAAITGATRCPALWLAAAFRAVV